MYSRLVLLVGPSGSGKTHALQEIAAEYGKKSIMSTLNCPKPCWKYRSNVIKADQSVFLAI
jgi:DNA transposition AAA+ family ATPase